MSLSYWEKRKAQMMYELMEDAEQAANEIAEVYYKSSRYLSLEAEQIFEKFRIKHKLSEKEARELISTLQDATNIQELKLKLQSSSIFNKADIIAQLEAPAYQSRLERLGQLQNSMDLVMQQVYGQEKAISTEFYTDLANEAYYHSMFEIQKQTGIGFSFAHLDPDYIDLILKTDWLGKNYSQRIWDNTGALAKDIKEELLISYLTGKTVRETTDIIVDKYSQGASVARRLVRTESNYISGQMDMLSYERCGIEEYIFVAVLDIDTSKKCRRLDGKWFKVSEQQPNVNCNPMHPWCRSTTIAGINKEILAKMKRTARDPVTGKNYKVPATMTYEEWYDEYVRGNSKAETAEKKLKNRHADKKQYEKYKDIIGEDAGKTFADFQDMKYNDSDYYKYLKLDYKRRNSLLENPGTKLPNAEQVVLPEPKFTKYLFNPDSPKGFAKGTAITSRLGYNAGNWNQLSKEISQGAVNYPAMPKGNKGYGEQYEQKIVVYGKKQTPANMVIGWIHGVDGVTKMTSAYIKEVE